MNFQDEKWMKQALRLAEKGRPWTSPNPLVGAVLVKNNRLISQGYHTAFGAPHAEVAAIRKAGSRSKGSTLYVTLEPCCTYGKTPPCTESIKRAGIKRVVVGAADPNPVHCGRGIRLLQKNKIVVTKGILKNQAMLQNEAFAKWITTRTPWVILKMAQSLDGKIASRTGNSRWISGPRARKWVHELRSQVDAILIGKNTLLRDDPRLTVRNGTARPLPPIVAARPQLNGQNRKAKSPWRIILDPRGECSRSAKIFKQTGPIILACSERFTSRVAEKFSEEGVTILPLKEKRGRLNLKQLLSSLGSLGITSLLVEGGGELAGSFIEQNLVDQVKWILAPKIVGGRTAKTSVEGSGIKLLSGATKIKSIRMSRLGEDFLLEGYVNS